MPPNTAPRKINSSHDPLKIICGDRLTLLVRGRTGILSGLRNPAWKPCGGVTEDAERTAGVTVAMAGPEPALAPGAEDHLQ
jgi:hypothetical protein